MNEGASTASDVFLKALLDASGQMKEVSRQIDRLAETQDRQGRELSGLHLSITKDLAEMRESIARSDERQRTTSEELVEVARATKENADALRTYDRWKERYIGGKVVVYTLVGFAGGGIALGWKWLGAKLGMQ